MDECLMICTPQSSRSSFLTPVRCVAATYRCSQINICGPIEILKLEGSDNHHAWINFTLTQIKHKPFEDHQRSITGGRHRQVKPPGRHLPTDRRQQRTETATSSPWPGFPLRAILLRHPRKWPARPDPRCRAESRWSGIKIVQGLIVRMGSNCWRS